MAVSVHYAAKRKAPLTCSEVATITAIVGHYRVDGQIEQFLATGKGLNWESFDFTVNPEPGGLLETGTVFSGSTKLPDNREDATWLGLQHWCRCLSAIRNAVPGCAWRVAVEDYPLQWDERAHAYDPSR
ncbi:hypothetical protein SAMN05216588_12642 [Pseudomonas flavescens]|uniref:Uncharacterized protein n=1 Tax=Phytopseudomonas flavescens TaxID=29435 RepID=A0A1G8NX32_9GAMM|nr:hypothetical protein [Pseudomonas flavescens]SDI84556.1 hypothetical protein SAMN05216588_12642 [Pseudomonas flavescens]